MFNIDITIDNREFFFFLADIFVTGVQYGNRNGMCEILEANSGSIGTLMQAVADLATSEGVAYDGYDAVTLSNTEIDVNNSSRQWTYQYCNEFGFFQTPNDDNPMRSQVLVESFWPDYCQRVFG